MRYTSLLFMLIFLLFAYLQLNDPDPIWWVTVYLVPAYVSYKAFRNEYSFEMLRVLIVLYGSYAITSWLAMSSFDGFFTEGAGIEMKTPNQELAREATGLAICIGVYLIYSICYFLNKKNTALPASYFEVI